MKTIIAGSRCISDVAHLVEALKQCTWDITEVVCGCALGVDTMGEWWAHDNNIPVTRFPAEWDRHGRKAGPMRNTQMANHADCLIAIWDGKSCGTADMIRKMQRLGKKVVIYVVQQT